MKRTVTDLPPWECMMKKMVWQQLGSITDKKILDFGSGMGVTANYLAEKNDVTAVEPDEDSVNNRWSDNAYLQLVGSTDKLHTLGDEAFDVILCHNVLEYAPDREQIVREFARLLKPDGKISIVKHNRAGRVMQMVVLLNQFEHARELLDGKDGTSSQYGAIHYYEDADIEKWCGGLKIIKTLGMRTFWDLQQNQDIQNDPDWQREMMKLEQRVSDRAEYQSIAFFHHVFLRKRG